MKITNRQIKYFNVAKSMSALSSFHRQHVGCVVVYKKQIISTGVNQYKSHTLQAIYNYHRGFNGHEYNSNIHAEIDALSKIRHMNLDWGKVEVYVYRETLNGELALARPCRACMGLIVDMGIRDVYYTTEYGYGYEKIV